MDEYLQIYGVLEEVPAAVLSNLVFIVLQLTEIPDTLHFYVLLKLLHWPN